MKKLKITYDFTHLPFYIIIYEILGKFYELDIKEWWLFEEPLYNDKTINKFKKEIKNRKLAYWRGDNDLIIEHLKYKKESYEKDLVKRINLLYGYFTRDKFRKSFLIFRNYKFFGCGLHRRLMYPIDIKGMRSLHFFEYESDLIGNREYETLESLHIIKGAEIKQNFSIIKNLKKLVLDNFKGLDKVKNWPNLKSLELIECDYMKEISHLKKLTSLKIKIHPKQWSTELPTQLLIENLPKIEKLQFKLARNDLSVNISSDVMNSIKCLELINCSYHFSEIRDLPNLKKLVIYKWIKPGFDFYDFDKPKIKVGNLKNLEVLSWNCLAVRYCDVHKLVIEEQTQKEKKVVNLLLEIRNGKKNSRVFI